MYLFCRLPRSQSEVLGPGPPMIAEFQGTEERGHAEKSSSQEHRDHPVQDRPNWEQRTNAGAEMQSKAGGPRDLDGSPARSRDWKTFLSDN